MAVSVEGLASTLKGRVVQPADANYDEARALYNGMIDRRPAAIAYCSRRGGCRRSPASGSSTSSGRRSRRRPQRRRPGLGRRRTGDRPLSHVGGRGRPAARQRRVGGARCSGTSTRATHQHGLAVPGGIIAHDRRRRADARRRRRDTYERGWASRSTTSWRPRSCSQTARSSQTRRRARAGALLGVARRGRQLRGRHLVLVPLPSRHHRARGAGAVRHRRRRRGAGLVPRLHASGARGARGFFAFCRFRPARRSRRSCTSKRSAGSSGRAGEEDPRPCVTRQCVRQAAARRDRARCRYPRGTAAFDGVYPPGDQWYWRGEFVGRSRTSRSPMHAEFGPKMPTWKSAMHLYPIDGAASRVGRRRTRPGRTGTRTGWCHRRCRPGSRQRRRDPRTGCVAYSDAIKPHGMGGGYVNFAMDEGPERVRGMYARTTTASRGSRRSTTRTTSSTSTRTSHPRPRTAPSGRNQ